eukprot:gene27300-biopygen8347
MWCGMESHTKHAYWEKGLKYSALSTFFAEKLGGLESAVEALPKYLVPHPNPEAEFRCILLNISEYSAGNAPMLTLSSTHATLALCTPSPDQTLSYNFFLSLSIQHVVRPVIFHFMLCGEPRIKWNADVRPTRTHFKL